MTTKKERIAEALAKVFRDHRTAMDMNPLNNTYTATCSCGWRSGSPRGMADVEGARDAHVVEVVLALRRAEPVGDESREALIEERNVWRSRAEQAEEEGRRLRIDLERAEGAAEPVGDKEMTADPTKSPEAVGRPVR